MIFCFEFSTVRHGAFEKKKHTLYILLFCKKKKQSQTFHIKKTISFHFLLSHFFEYINQKWILKPIFNEV